MRFGEVQYISLPAESPHTLLLNGNDNGSFTLEMQEKENNRIVATTTFAAIPCASGTIASMIVDGGKIQDAQPLNVDYNGDGDIDYSLEPKINETVTPPTTDQTPPEAKIFFDINTNAIRIEGIDESPSTVTYSRTPIIKKNHRQDGFIVRANIADQAGNTTIITYGEKPAGANKNIIEINSISYNGAVSYFDKTTVKYKWNKKADAYKMLAAYLAIEKEKVEAHYRPKKNVTYIMAKALDLDDQDEDDDCETRTTKKKLTGLVVPGIITDQGEINIYY